MKKRIISVLALVLVIALSVVLMTACDLFGKKDETSENSGTTEKTMTAQECKNEVAAATTASLAKKNYEFNLTTDSFLGRTSVISEVTENAIHVTSSAAGVNATDTYFYVSEGKYYMSNKVGNIYTETELSASVYQERIASYRLTAEFGNGLKLEADENGAEVTITGKKTGSKVHIEFVSEAQKGSKTVRLEKYIDINNGLVTNVLIRETETENGAPTDSGETTVTITYDNVVVNLPDKE